MKSEEEWFVLFVREDNAQLSRGNICRIQADAREGMVDAEEVGKAREEALREAEEIARAEAVRGKPASQCPWETTAYNIKDAIRALWEKEEEGGTTTSTVDRNR